MRIDDGLATSGLCDPPPGSPRGWAGSCGSRALAVVQARCEVMKYDADARSSAPSGGPACAAPARPRPPACCVAGARAQLLLPEHPGDLWMGDSMHGPRDRGVTDDEVHGTSRGIRASFRTRGQARHTIENESLGARARDHGYAKADEPIS